MLHIKLFWILVTATTSLASTSGTIVTSETTVTVVTASMAFTVTDIHLMISADPSVSQSGNNIISNPVLSYTMTPAVSNTAVADPQSSSDDSGSSVEIIAGCVIGVVLCITLLLVVIILLWCHLRRRKGKLDVSQG